jgi:hypothetical protein
VTSTFETTRRFRREGRTIILDVPHDEAGWQTWGCAIAGVATPDTLAATYDALGGMLHDVDAKPQLLLGKAMLLGEDDQPIELVRGVWTVLEVPVFNDGRVSAPGVKISGDGAGVVVESMSVGKVFAGGEETARVRVKLVDGGKSRFELKARSGAISASISTRVKSVDAPERPRNGEYGSADGKVSFRVKDGKMIQWRGRQLQMRCAPPFEFPTYRTVSLEFPDKKIPRNDIVDAQKRYEEGDVWYNSRLSMRVAGSKATDGEFTYVTAGSCRVNVDFTARCVGK